MPTTYRDYADDDEQNLPDEHNHRGWVLVAKTSGGNAYHVATHGHCETTKTFQGKDTHFDYDRLEGLCGQELDGYQDGSEFYHVPTDDYYDYIPADIIDPDDDMQNICTRCATRFTDD